MSRKRSFHNSRFVKENLDEGGVQCCINAVRRHLRMTLLVLMRPEYAELIRNCSRKVLKRPQDRQHLERKPCPAVASSRITSMKETYSASFLMLHWKITLMMWISALWEGAEVVHMVMWASSRKPYAAAASSRATSMKETCSVDLLKLSLMDD